MIDAGRGGDAPDLTGHISGMIAIRTMHGVRLVCGMIMVRSFIVLTCTTSYQRAARILLGVGMLAAGMGHLTFQRKAFQAQVPEWVPLDKDLTVVLSGYVELALGLAMVIGGRYRTRYGLALALFFVAVFPGNIAQYLNRTDAFGLDTDAKRSARLFFQPLLIAWALWSSGAYAAWRARRTAMLLEER